MISFEESLSSVTSTPLLLHKLEDYLVGEILEMFVGDEDIENVVVDDEDIAKVVVGDEDIEKAVFGDDGDKEAVIGRCHLSQR